MIRVESVRIALTGILHNRMRSALTMLGMLIGVGSVIMLVAVGTGSSRAVQKTIEGLGTNLLQISPQATGFGGGGGFSSRPSGGRATLGTRSRGASLTAADVTALRDKTQNPDVVAVTPVAAGSVTAVYQGASYTPSSFVGTTPEYQQIKDYQLTEGSFFTDVDVSQRNRVAVIGQTVAQNLFGAADPVGNNVQFNGANFQVVGLLKQKGTNGAQDQDDVVIAPLSAVQDTITGYGSYQNIDVEAVSPSKEAAAERPHGPAARHPRLPTAPRRRPRSRAARGLRVDGPRRSARRAHRRRGTDASRLQRLPRAPDSRVWTFASPWRPKYGVYTTESILINQST